MLLMLFPKRDEENLAIFTVAFKDVLLSNMLFFQRVYFLTDLICMMIYMIYPYHTSLLIIGLRFSTGSCYELIVESI